MASISNPFIVGKYVADEYFCDRRSETDFLIKQITNGRNVALISPRRMGKTELIHHLMRQPQIAEHYHTFFVDIYATSSLTEMVYLLGKAIYAKLASKPVQWLRSFFSAVTSLQPGFKVDAMSGEPTFDISLGDIKAPQITLAEIFTYLQQSERPCVVAIDEFQQIGAYKETNTEALLRGYIQNCPNASFIFSGSKRHMMNNMFNSPAKPFYRSCITMGLDPIPLEVYTDFAQKQFESFGKSITAEAVAQVYRLYNGCTWYLQIIMNELFAITPSGDACNETMLEEAQRNVVLAQQQSYLEQMAILSPRQKQLLQAIAREGNAANITSQAFVSHNRLPSSSSVQSAARQLLADDVITREGDSYRVSDYFLGIYLAKYF
ncbi:MAG: ATP-binding protein [Muribaculaceae bacterium]